MFVRLAFSVAAHFEPEVMIVDEVLSVGDADFQRRSLGRMETIGESGRTVLFVSHNLQGILQLCDRTILLEEGRIMRQGTTGDVVAFYEQRRSVLAQSTCGTTRRCTGQRPRSSAVDRASSTKTARSMSTADVRRSGRGASWASGARHGTPIVPKSRSSTSTATICFNAHGR